jgi:hypothetical protein
MTRGPRASISSATTSTDLTDGRQAQMQPAIPVRPARRRRMPNMAAGPGWSISRPQPRRTAGVRALTKSWADHTPLNPVRRPADSDLPSMRSSADASDVEGREQIILIENPCMTLRFGRSVVRSGGAGSRLSCRPVTAWLSDDVPAPPGLAVVWLIRGANAGRSDIRYARHGSLQVEQEGRSGGWRL